MSVSNGPAMVGFAITPNDSTNLTTVTRAIYVGGAGDLVVRFPGSSTSITFNDVPAGTVLPICVTRVLSTGTVATELIGLY